MKIINEKSKNLFKRFNLTDLINTKFTSIKIYYRKWIILQKQKYSKAKLLILAGVTISLLLDEKFKNSIKRFQWKWIL